MAARPRDTFPRFVGMGTMQKTAIIVPCYNEAKRLNRQAFADYAVSNPNTSFIMVNDGSADGTWPLLRELGNKSGQQVIPVNLAANMGKAEAVRQGFCKAFEFDFTYIGYWDADLATPLNEINTFQECLGSSGKDMVFGSRVRLLGRPIERVALRHYLGRLFATLASLILQITIYDTQCGAKLFRNTKELQMVFSKPFATNWIFDVELIARIIAINDYLNNPPIETSAVEYPLHQWSDIPGSKLRLPDFFKAAQELVSIAIFLHTPGRSERCKTLVAKSTLRVSSD